MQDERTPPILSRTAATGVGPTSISGRPPALMWPVAHKVNPLSNMTELGQEHASMSAWARVRSSPHTGRRLADQLLRFRARTGRRGTRTICRLVLSEP